MTRIVSAALLGFCLLVAACTDEAAFAQNLQPTGLPARGAVVGTDVFVDQPAGSSTVQGAQASAIATYVQANLNLIGGLTGDCTATGPGTAAIVCTKTNGTAFGTFATQSYGSLPSASGSPPISASTTFPCVPSTALAGCSGAQLLAYLANGPIGADPTGVADSTSALQAWLSTGAPGTIPCGTFKTTATLTMQGLANSGQQVRGSGSGSSAGGGGCRTVIQPTSAVTTALIIDGTPVSVWTMSMGLHNLVIDMANMTDASTTSAINQIKSYDVSYENIRVINYGTSKRSWLVNAGAFTTLAYNIQGGIFDMEGSSPSYEVTTVTLVNPDITQVIGNYVANFKIYGGAVQCSACNAFTFHYASNIDLNTDVESLGGTAGIAYSFDTTDVGIRLQNEMNGWTGTYMSGAPFGGSYVNLDDTSSNTSCPWAIHRGFIAVNDCGAGDNYDRSQFLSGSNGQKNSLYLGRLNGESIWGVAAASNDFISGTATGDTVIGSNASGEALWLFSAGNPVAKLTTSAFTLASGVALSVPTSPQTFTSGSSSTDEEIYLGLLGGSSFVGVAAGTNHITGGTVSGDMVIGSNASGQHTFIMAGGNPAMKYDSFAHQYSQGYPAPTAGTGTAIATGNDNVFTMTAGSSVTSSAVSFGGTWATTPKCIATANSAAAFPYISSVSTTSFTLGWSGSVSGAVATVHCEG